MQEYRTEKRSAALVGRRDRREVTVICAMSGQAEAALHAGHAVGLRPVSLRPSCQPVRTTQLERRETRGGSECGNGMGRAQRLDRLGALPCASGAPMGRRRGVLAGVLTGAPRPCCILGQWQLQRWKISGWHPLGDVPTAAAPARDIDTKHARHCRQIPVPLLLHIRLPRSPTHDLLRTPPPNGARPARYDAQDEENVELKRGTEHLSTAVLKRGRDVGEERGSWDELITSCANEASRVQEPVQL
ncbi:hypothetical protein F4823DRAFT_558494 [Ustulina deusta]|nr:hypothetical protein F4823DRAFT_558494 [Ustulina deusta]